MSVPSWARKGAKVVCIRYGDTHNANTSFGVEYPQIGVVYTIREVVGHTLRGHTGIRLEEIRNPEVPYEWRGAINRHEAAWNVDRFRPLVDDANDAETEREIYRKKVHQNVAPRKNSVDA